MEVQKMFALMIAHNISREKKNQRKKKSKKKNNLNYYIIFIYNT